MASTIHTIPAEDRMRADLYNYLGLMLAAPANEILLAQTAGLSGDDATDLGRAIAGLARVARATTSGAVETEFNKLFVGLGRGELLPYASYYLTGHLNEKPLAALRADMAHRRIGRAPNVFEPEDNIASLMEIMGGLIVGRFGYPASVDEQRTFFDRHVGPWAAQFFSDLEAAKSSVLYASLGQVGRIFMEIEREAFRMAAGSDLG